MQQSEFSQFYNRLFSGWKSWLHLSFWTVHLLIRTFFSKYYSDLFWENFLIELTELPVKLIIAYFGIFLIDRFFAQFKFRPFLLGLIANLSFAWFLKRIHDQLIIYPIIYRNDASLTFQFWDFAEGVFQLIYVYPTVVGIIALTFTTEWFQNERKNQELERLNRENELRYLKSQIQPHFLFNTLNNLYALSLDKSDLAPEVILHLSDLLSYMLYRADKSSIPLKDEVEIIENLYQLESLRSSQPVDLLFEKDLRDPEQQVPPLLLFPLAENAFKYGIGDEIGGSTIHFQLTQTENEITFQTCNQIKTEVKSDDKSTQGFGLNTLERRLDLLFLEKYDLKIQKKDGMFYSTLNLRIQ